MEVGGEMLADSGEGLAEVFKRRIQHGKRKEKVVLGYPTVEIEWGKTEEI